MGNTGNPDHVTRDVVVDIEACFENGASFGVSWTSKSQPSQKSLCFETKIAAPRWQCGTSLWMKWFILL